jgi:hypothetical protein
VVQDEACAWLFADMEEPHEMSPCEHSMCTLASMLAQARAASLPSLTRCCQ